MPNTIADDNVDAIGKATPAASPATATPAGTVAKLAPALDMATTGNTFAVLSKDGLHIGSAEDFKKSQARTVELSPTCADVSSAEGAFLISCETEVRRVDAASGQVTETIPAPPEFKVTSAAQLRSGELFMASVETNHVAVFKDGKQDDDFPVAAGTDQLEAVFNDPYLNGSDGTKIVDNVVRIYRTDSTIQSLDWKNSREGGRLRVGQGVGQISDGRHGVVVASDTNGHRLAIYTAEDVVRLHQFGNVDGSPWGTAWDDSRQLAWVTTPDNNQAHAYSIETGVPVLKGSVNVLADAHFVGVADNGTVLVASAGDDGVQIIDNPDFKTP